MVFASLKKIANWPAFLVKLLYIITLPIVFIRLLLTKIPIIQDIVFWFFIPEISNDEKQDPIAYRRAMLEIEKQFDAGVGVDIRHFYIKVDDDVYLHAAAAGSQTKPLMLFLHGFPEFWYTWRHLLKEFSKDYYCVAIDQRGYNISSKPKKFTDYAQYYMICDVEKVVQDLGFNHCILVAHDWGGCIAWHVAHCFDFVDQLIVMNMPHPSAMSKALQSTPQQRKSVYMLYFQIPMLPDTLLSKNGGEAVANLIANQLITTPATAGDKAAFAHAACRPGAMTGALNWYRAVFGGRVKKWRVKQLEQPVLFLYGTGDVAFDMESVLPATERYCKNLTTITIDRCSHWTQNDQPKIVIKHMKAFLDKHRAE